MHMNSLLFLLVSTLPVDAYLTTTARLPEAVVQVGDIHGIQWT